MKYKVFRIIATFRKSYSILLDFSEDRLYLIIVTSNETYYFSQNVKLCVTLQILFSYLNSRTESSSRTSKH